MTQLVEAMEALGLDGDVSLGGRWITIRGDRAPVHVMELLRGRGFCTWCDLVTERAVECHREAANAILAGLRRAAHLDTGSETTTGNARACLAPASSRRADGRTES